MLKYFSIIFPVEIERQGIYWSLERAQDLKDKQDCGSTEVCKNISILQWGTVEGWWTYDQSYFRMENQIFKKTYPLKDDWKGSGPLKRQF